MMNKKNVWIIVLFILLGIIAFVFAGGKEVVKEREVDLYFFDKSGYSITPLKTEIVAKTDAELHEKVAKALIEGPQDKKFLPIMEKSVSVNNIIFKDGNMTIDFSGAYPAENYMCTYAVIKTFSRLSGVDAVQVFVNGKGIQGADGTEMGFLSADEVNTESDEDTATGVRLYFANAKKDQLVMEYRKINIIDTKPVEQYVVGELIKGPKIKGNERLLSQDTKILSVETTDGICYVNFKKGFVEKNMTADDGGRLVIESLVKSLTGLNNVNSVQFLVDGKKTESSGETDISVQFEQKNETEIPGIN